MRSGDARSAGPQYLWVDCFKSDRVRYQVADAGAGISSLHAPKVPRGRVRELSADQKAPMIVGCQVFWNVEEDFEIRLPDDCS